MNVETQNYLKGLGCMLTVLIASLIAWYTGYRFVKMLWEALT